MFHALDRDTGEVVWETPLTPGSVFGGEIGSAAFVDGRLVRRSNVGDPDDERTDRRHQGVRARSRERRHPVGTDQLAG